jgi:hypothetical protein
MTIDSQDHYFIQWGWSVKDALTSEGVQYVKMYVKNNQSLTDPITVEYAPGQRENVPGVYLYTSLDDANAFLQEQMEGEIQQKRNQIAILEWEIEEIEISYGAIPYDDEVQF